jgi:starch-binding outer membrane protein, SusD/RagB family
MIMNNIRQKLCLGMLLFMLAFTSCTDLEPKPYSVVTPDVFWSDPRQAANAVAPVYDALDGFANGENMRLANSTSGQIFEPGGRWGGQEYLELSWKHNFVPDVSTYNQMWNTFYKGVGSATFILSQLDSLPNKPANIATVNAELRVMRAFFLYHAMDNFGSIPLDTLYGADPNTLRQATRQQAYNYLERELVKNAPLLNENGPTNYGRANKYVAYTLLAQLYMNAQVYTGTAQWAKAIAACDKVIGSGRYSLTPNYFNNFGIDNNNYTQENILVAPKQRGRRNFPGMMETLYGGNAGNAVGLPGGGWNGFCATADIYNKYQAADLRRRQWLVGQQKQANGTRTIDDNYTPGADIFEGPNPIFYNLNTVSFRAANYPSQIAYQMTGARNVKYYPEQGGNFGADMGNDLVIMRYADVLLMKVEAELRLNGSVTSINLLNAIRTRAYGNSNHNIANPTLDDIFDERTRELMWEGYGRRDQIRFEVASGIPYWSGPRNPEKGPDPGTFTRIFPIPSGQLQANRNLVQNPGY